MSFGAVADVVIGLVFTYFLLALLASGLQEVVAGIFQWRGTYLSKGIDVILDNVGSAEFRWHGVADFLCAHLTWRLPVTAAEKMAAHPGVQAPGAPAEALEALRDGSQAPLFTQAERTVSSLPEGDLKRTLSLFLQNAGGDLDAFRTQIETWFDDAMDRLSGIYARISQYSLIVFGVLLALSLNVDSVRLARTLWQDSAMRGQLVATAAATVDQPPPNAATPDTSARQALQLLQSQDLPIGWSAATHLIGAQAVMSAIFGWLFTAAAVALGAPFWSSLLQQLTNLRSAGPKPSRADPGASTSFQRRE